MKILLIVFAIASAAAQAQQATSRRNVFGGEDVYLDGRPAYSTRRNVFSGRDWLLPNHRYPGRGVYRKRYHDPSDWWPLPGERALERRFFD